MRATCLTIHPYLSNTLLVGYEDGSIRTLHIQQTPQNTLEFHSVNLLRPQKSWFDSCPVRAIRFQHDYPNQFLIVDEVSIKPRSFIYREGVCIYGTMNRMVNVLVAVSIVIVLKIYMI